MKMHQHSAYAQTYNILLDHMANQLVQETC